MGSDGGKEGRGRTEKEVGEREEREEGKGKGRRREGFEKMMRYRPICTNS